MNNLFETIFAEAHESYDRDSIKGPKALTHLFRACFAGEELRPAWNALAQVCVGKATEAGKPEREGLIRAWELFMHHVCLNPVPWVGFQEEDEDGMNPDPPEVEEIRDDIIDLLIEDFVQLHKRGDAEALRAYGDADLPLVGVYWKVSDSRREYRRANARSLNALCGESPSKWIDELERIKNGPCTFSVNHDVHGVMAEADYTEKVTVQ